jgi:hypothetical protein
MDKAPDTKELSQRFEVPFPFESEIGRRLSIGDVCWYKPGMLNKIGKEGKTSWDSFSYSLMMAHNVYCHIVAVQRANNLMDIELKNKSRMPWRSYRAKVKDNDFSDEISDWVPRNILYFDTFVEELFQCKTKDEAFRLIEDATTLGFLNGVEGARLRGGKKSIVDSLFYEEGDEDKAPYEDEREDIELDKLTNKLHQE